MLPSTGLRGVPGRRSLRLRAVRLLAVAILAVAAMGLLPAAGAAAPLDHDARVDPGDDGTTVANVTTSAGSTSLDERLDTAAGVEAAVEAGTLANRSRVTVSETLVIGLNVSGPGTDAILDEPALDQEPTDPAASLAPNVSVAVQWVPERGVEPVHLHLDGEGVEVVGDGEDHAYLIVDTRAVDLHRNGTRLGASLATHDALPYRVVAWTGALPAEHPHAVEADHENATTAEVRFEPRFPTVDGVETHVGAADAASELTDVDDVRAAIEDGAVASRDRLLANQTLVLELDASGLSATIPDEGVTLDGTAGEPAVGLSGDLSVAVRQVNDPVHDPPAHLGLERSADVRVVSDRPNDTHYLVVDTATVTVADEYGERDLSPGQRYRVAAWSGEPPDGVWSAEGPAPTDVSAVDRVEVVPFEARVASPAPDRRVLPAGQGRALHVASEDLAPGSEVEVTVRNSSGAVATRSEPVEGAWNDTVVRTAVDLHATAIGEEVRVRLRTPGDRTWTSDPLPLERPAVAVGGDATYDDGSNALAIPDVEPDWGGFVAVHRGSVDGEVLGRSASLPAGEPTTVTVDLPAGVANESATDLVAVAYYDPAGNDSTGVERAQSYGAGDGPVLDRVTVEPPDGGGSGGSDPAAGGDAGGNGTSTAASAGGDESGDGAVGQPGFGPLAALAGIAAGLARLRHRSG